MGHLILCSCCCEPTTGACGRTTQHMPLHGTPRMQLMLQASSWCMQRGQSTMRRGIEHNKGHLMWRSSSCMPATSMQRDHR
eukprot:1144388-Pelagomonas_calceolata.AAC.2